MSNRFYQKYFLQCGQCRAVQRSAQGYRPLANPILFNSDEQCRNYHAEQRRAASYSGLRVTCRCDKCERVHSNWRVMDSQQFLDHKLSLSAEERKAQLWSSSS